MSPMPELPIPSRADRLEAVRAEGAQILDLCRSLDDDQWGTASVAAGWSVRDVVAHMAANWLFAVPRECGFAVMGVHAALLAALVRRIRAV